MAPAIVYALPAMQLVCNLIVPQTPSFNITNVQVPVTPSIDVTASPDASPGVPPLSAQPLRSVILPPDYIPHPEIGVAYKVSTDQVTWKLAREACLGEGGRLAVIDNIIKFESLMNQTIMSNIHVGIHRMYDDAEWVSATTGSTIETLPWAPSEPWGDFDCVRTSRGPRGLINDACHNKWNYACEIPIPEIYDTQENQMAMLVAN